ncbi:MAG: hypothetical protein R3D31_03435 [Hyphomicrobiaceae bacterium]
MSSRTERETSPEGPIEYIRLTRERYQRHGYAEYRWVANPEASALVVPNKPLSESRVAVVVSGGAYVAGQVAFHYKDDSSLRAIPKSVEVGQLRFSHVSEHFLDNARLDPNCLVPVGALARLEQEGIVGEVIDPVLSCMGGIYSQRRVGEELIPAIAEAVARGRADAVLLVPMCPICHQTMSVLARHLERTGLPTVCIVSAYDIVASANPPRAVFVDYPLGHTAGRPHDMQDQYDIVRRALEALHGVTRPGTIIDLGRRWDRDPDWKAKTRAEVEQDRRGARDTTPRYQLPADKELAERNMAAGG